MFTLLLLFSRKFRSLVWMVLIVSVAMLIWPAYLATVPTRPHYSSRQLRMIDDLSKHVGQWISQLHLERDLAVFAVFMRDPFGTVSFAARDAIWRSDRFDLTDPGVAEKLRERLRFRLRMYPPDEAITRLGVKARARYAIGGEVESFLDDSRQGRLIVRIAIWDVPSVGRIAEKEFVISDSHNSMTLFGERTLGLQAIPITQRLFAWMVLCGLMPFLAFVRRSIFIECSNEARLAILLSLVLLSGCAAYFLVVGGLEPFWNGAVMLCLVPLSAVYHWKALSFLRDHLQ